MKHIIKQAVAFLAFALLAAACSQKTESATGKPQFAIAAGDLAVPAEVGTNGAGSGHDTIVVHLQFSAARTEAFRKFTHEHMNQQTQLVVGSKVVAEPYVVTEISDGKADLDFSSLEQARAVMDSLEKK